MIYLLCIIIGIAVGTGITVQVMDSRLDDLASWASKNKGIDLKPIIEEYRTK